MYDAQNPYNRSRLTDSRTTTYVSFKQTRTGVADWIDGPYPKSWKQGVYRSIQDQIHPNFKRRIAKGEPIFGNLLLVNTERSAANISATTPAYLYAGKTCTYSAFGDLCGYYENSSSILASLLSVSAADQDRAVGVALVNAYAKMNSASLMSGEILADLDQTVSMLRRPMKGAIDLVARMAKSKQRHLGKTAASAQRATANTWLEYRYGWKPLLMDADTIVGGATKMAASHKKRLVARASESQELNSTKSFSADGGGTTWLKASGSCTLRNSVQAHAGCLYEVVNRTTSEQLLAFFGLRPRDVPATLWEITPYSFVVDWFVNVGPWIQAITPVPGINVLGTWVTVKNMKTITATCSSFQLLADGAWRNASGSGESSTTTQTVKRACNLPMASTPVLTGKSLSTLRSVDGLALLANKVVDGLKKFNR